MSFLYYFKAAYCWKGFCLYLIIAGIRVGNPMEACGRTRDITAVELVRDMGIGMGKIVRKNVWNCMFCDSFNGYVNGGERIKKQDRRGVRE